MQEKITAQPQGILKNEKGETIILLPAGPIRSTVIGMSGDIYRQTLHDDAQLGRPTAKLDTGTAATSA